MKLLLANIDWKIAKTKCARVGIRFKLNAQGLELDLL